MAEPGKFYGGCLCGAIGFQFTGPVTSIVHCHCTVCRRSSGAAHTTWITVPRAAFELVRGEPATFKSSEHGERQFCPSCGSQLTFCSTSDPDEIDITLGTLDTPQSFRPDRHIHTISRLPWLHLDEDLPCYPGSTADGVA